MRDNGFALPTSELQLSSEETPPGNPISFLQTQRESGDLSAIENWLWQAAEDYNKLLLSAECFSEWFWHKPFVELSEKVDIHLLYYVRRQDEVLLSAWRQWGLKKGMSLDAFIKHRVVEKHPDYLNILWPWLNKVSVKRFHVNFVSDNFLGGKGLLENAAYWLGIDYGKMQLVKNQNISVDARLLQFMSSRPQYFETIHDDTILQLLSSAFPSQKPLRLSLNEEQFELIQGTFEPTNQELLRRFQPALAGTPVIDRESAPVDDQKLWINERTQRDYVLDCLGALKNKEDDRIDALYKELGC